MQINWKLETRNLMLETAACSSSIFGFETSQKEHSYLGAFQINFKKIEQEDEICF